LPEKGQKASIYLICIGGFGFPLRFFVGETIIQPPLCKGRCHFRKKMTEGLYVSVSPRVGLVFARKNEKLAPPARQGDIAFALTDKNAE